MPDNVDIIGDVDIDNHNKGRWFNTCTLGADGVTRNACADPGVDDRAADPGRAPLDPAFRDSAGQLDRHDRFAHGCRSG